MTTFQRTDFSSPLGSKSSDTLLPALAAILMLVATSEQADAQILYVGNGSSDQTTSFTSGTNTYTGAFIGNTSTDSNNTLNVLNPGTRLTINGGNVQVGFAGSGNSMVISNGGFVSDVTGAISFGAGSNNSVLVTGAGSTWSNSNQVRLGVAGQASLTVANEGSVIATGVNGIQVAVSNNSVGVLNIGSFGGSDSAGSIVAPKIAFNSGTGYLNFNQTNTFTLTNAITGGNTIVFQQLGSGTTILTGANSSANSTFISQGTLQIGDGGANGSIGSRAITNNSVLAINSSTNITFGSGKGITGTGVLVQMGTGTTTLNGSNTTYSGGTLISDGTLRVGAGPTGSASDANGSLGTGNVTNNATLLFSRRTASDTVSNNISGTGALTMFGSGGGLTLVGSNSYSGLTTIGSGYTLQIGTGGTNGTLGTGSVSNAGTLSFNRSDLYTASSAISGVGPLRQIGTGTTALSGSNTYTGTTSIGAGTLLFQNKNALYGGDSSLWTAANIIVSNNATAAFGVGGVSGFTTSNVTTLLGNLTAVNNAGLRAGSSIGFDTTADDFILTNNVANSTGAGGGSLGLTKLGLGTLTLSASNNFSGPISVKAGTLALASVTGSAAGSASSVTVTNGATLLVSQSEQVMNSATVTLSGGTIARGSGVSETFGNLSLTEASFFDFGAGTAGRMTFGTYQNNTPPSALLTVNNFLPGNTLVFGSDLTSTITNTSLFQFSGEFTSAWNGGNSTFTITAIPESSTYVAALGLLALCAWPLLRRKRAKIS